MPENDDLSRTLGISFYPVFSLVLNRVVAVYLLVKKTNFGLGKIAICGSYGAVRSFLADYAHLPGCYWAMKAEYRGLPEGQESDQPLAVFERSDSAAAAVFCKRLIQEHLHGPTGVCVAGSRPDD